MSVLDFDAYLPKEEVEKPPCPVKIVVLALDKDHQGIRAKLLAEALHKRFPKLYPKPLVKVFHDVGWRETLIRLRKATKRWDYAAPVIVFANKRLIGDDDDFQLYIKEKLFLMIDPQKIHTFKGMSQLDKLRMDPKKTYVYFDMSINYRPVGRMIFQIESDLMPKSTKEFLHLCCSQKVPLPNESYRRSKFAGSLIQRIVKKGWIRVTTVNDERVYTKGKTEPPALSHDRRGTLSLNIGKKGWLGSHVIITLDQHLWMDKMYKAIGHLVDGEFILHMIENVETAYEHPNLDVCITDNGILHSPILVTTEGFATDEMLRANSILKAFEDEYRTVLNAYVGAEPYLKPDVKELLTKEESKGLEDRQDREEAQTKIEEIRSEVKWEAPPPSEKLDEQSKSMIFDVASNATYGRFVDSSSVALFPSSTMSIGSDKLAKSKGISTTGLWSQKSFERSKSSRNLLSTTSVTTKDSISDPKEATNATPEEEPWATEASAVLDEMTVGEGEEVGEFDKLAETESKRSETDIHFTYSVPNEMVDRRTGYKKFEGEKYIQSYDKVGMKLPKRMQSARHDYQEEPRKFQYVKPYTRTRGESRYQVSEKTMEQVTPQLLLDWAQKIDDDDQICEIEKAVAELVDFAFDKAEPVDPETHPWDAISMEDFTERYRKCLFSLPPQLLRILKESLEQIAARQDDDDDGEGLLVTGDSTSEIKLIGAKKTKKSPSEGVISGCMIDLIEFTRRMIESCTELVPNMKNLDFVTSLIDDIIFERMPKASPRINAKNQIEKSQSTKFGLLEIGYPTLPNGLSLVSHSNTSIRQ